MQEDLQTSHPLANESFIKSLESTLCVSRQSGWTPQHFNTKSAILPSYIKSHSYGEYIFDWNWAQFYESNQLNYYPKLLHAIPFTPVNAPKLIGNKNDFQDLANQSFLFYQKENLSSEHYLFINEGEEKVLNDLGFAIKLSHQYHFYNDYQSFEHFLSELKKNKRKNIKRERKAIESSELEIRRFVGSSITSHQLDTLYQLYLCTIQKKQSYPYLNRAFFQSLIDQNILIVSANKGTQTIAMALFFYGSNTLYGRNWGILPQFENQYPFLHFELCYYQGIEFCIQQNLKVFEAGAQGEHKLLRGFKPVIIKSAHHIKIPQCFEIIKQDIAAQNRETKQLTHYLNSFLPFKNQ